MFKKHILGTLLVLLIVAVTSTIMVLSYSEADLRALQEIVKADDVEPTRPLHQQRTSVRRDLRSSKELSKNIVLFGDQADLSLDFSHKAAIENLVNPRAYIQDDLFVDAQGNPLQLLRHLAANRGSYHHLEHYVELDIVSVTQFTTLGHTITENMPLQDITVQGSARSAKVFLNEGPRFEVVEPRAFTSTGIKIRAKHADYDSQKLHLNGEVEIEGSGGKAQAKAMTLLDICDGTCKQVLLQENVRIQADSGAHLTCDQADINLTDGNAFFSAAVSEGLVHGYHTLEGIPSEIESHRLKVFFTGALNQLQISEVVAEGAVSISREHHWQAKSDVVSYVKNAGETLTTFLTTDNSHECIVTTPAGDTLYAQKIVNDTAHSELIFYHAHGQLSSTDKGAITFAAKEAHWNSTEEVLTLLGGSMVEDVMGHMENDELVTIHLNTKGNARELLTLEAAGYTSITMKPKGLSPAQRLSSHGRVMVDHKAQKAHFLSLTDAYGKVSRKTQVCFIDGAAELHADTLHINYQSDDGDIKPILVVAEGDVCLKGRLGADASALGGSYALCDQLDFHPETQTVLLTARQGRVALLDRPNGIAISSPAVKVHRDPASGKEIVRGIGDVRFSLLDREYEWIKDRFNVDLE